MLRIKFMVTSIFEVSFMWMPLDTFYEGVAEGGLLFGIQQD